MDSEKSAMTAAAGTDYKMVEDGRISATEYVEQFKLEMAPLMSMMTDYECAAMEVETKFRVLNTRLSLNGESNPIETVRTRIKSLDSIVRKLETRGYPITIESARENIHDIAGVRVVCSFIDDIYRIEKLFLQQDDVELVTRKDYIKNPKPSGYRSLHLVIKTPVFTESGRKEMFVEVQMRTIAMDFWASLEHKLRYKKDLDPQLLQKLSDELENCAARSAELDERMQAVRSEISYVNREE